MSEPLRIELEEGATAEEILRFALHRAREERRGQQHCVNDLYADLAYAEEQLRQAQTAERALAALLDSAEFKSGTAEAAAPVAARPEPPAPVETINLRRARFPGDPIAAALDDLAEAVVFEASAPVLVVEPEPTAQPEPIVEPICQPATAEEPPAVRKSPSFQERRGGKAAAFQREDEDRLLTAIAKLSGATGEVQVSLTALAEASGIPTGSMTFVVRRAVDAGQLEVTKNFRPGSRTPAPSTYRLTGVQPVQTEAKYSDPIPAPAAAPRADDPLSAHQADVLQAMRGLAEASGALTCRRSDILARCKLSTSVHTWTGCRDALAAKGFLKVVKVGWSRAPSTFQVLMEPGTAEGRAAWAAAPRGPTAPLPKAAPTLPAVLQASNRPKESVLWEKSEPMAKTRLARAIPATDCPAVPAAAPPRPDQALVIPVDLDDADLPAWWPPGSLLALKYGDCRWPTNTPPVGRGEEMKFCCAPVVEGESYCPAHAAKAHGRSVSA